MLALLRQRLQWKSFFACSEAKKIGMESVSAAQHIFRTFLVLYYNLQLQNVPVYNTCISRHFIHRRANKNANGADNNKESKRSKAPP